MVLCLSDPLRYGSLGDAESCKRLKSKAEKQGIYLGHKGEAAVLEALLHEWKKLGRPSDLLTLPSRQQVLNSAKEVLSLTYSKGMAGMATRSASLCCTHPDVLPSGRNIGRSHCSHGLYECIRRSLLWCLSHSIGECQVIIVMSNHGHLQMERQVSSLLAALSSMDLIWRLAPLSLQQAGSFLRWQGNLLIVHLASPILMTSA